MDQRLGNVVFGDSFDSYYFGKSPMESDLYIANRHFQEDKMKAPVLIFPWHRGPPCPTAQSCRIPRLANTTETCR